MEIRRLGHQIHAIVFGIWLTATCVTGQQFYDATIGSGLEWPANDSLWRWEIMHTAVIDYDNDGDLDVWTSPHRWGQLTETPIQRPILWRNLGEAGFSRLRLDNIYVNNGDKHETIWFDYDNDGDLDLYINTGGRAGEFPPTPLHRGLYRNDGNDVFTDIGGVVGLSPSVGSGRSNAVFDWNNDGLLDFVQFNVDVSGQGPYSRLYLHMPDGTFALQNASSGFDIPGSAFFGMVADLFGDGVPDLLCFDGEYNNLGFLVRAYEIAVPLVDRRAELPVEIRTTGDNLRDAVVGDFNGDLVADIIAVGTPNLGASNSATNEEELPQHIKNAKAAPVYIQSVAEGGYISRIDAGLVPYYGMSVGAGDFDNDGDLDLYMLGQVGKLRMEPKFYLNDGAGNFTEVENANGANRAMQEDFLHVYDQAAGMGFVVGDINNDGFMDIYAAPQPSTEYYRPPGSPKDMAPFALLPALYLNHGNSNNWVQFDLVGTESARDAVGAKIYITAGGKVQLREISNGQRRLAQDTKRVHFGLGQAESIEQIWIQWPSGIINRLTNIAANQIYTVTEASPYAVWASGYEWPTPGVDDVLDADPNRDGVANLLAYATDLHPLMVNAASPIVSTELSNDGSEVSFTYRRAFGGAPGVLYEILQSTDMGHEDPWTVVDFEVDGSSLTVLPDDPDGDGTAEHVLATVTVADSAPVFLKLQVKLVGM